MNIQMLWASAFSEFILNFSTQVTLAGSCQSWKLAGIMPTFIFGSQTHFWQLARRSQISGTEKRLWQNPAAKVDLWHNHAISLFWHVQWSLMLQSGPNPHKLTPTLCIPSTSFKPIYSIWNLAISNLLAWKTQYFFCKLCMVLQDESPYIFGRWW